METCGSTISLWSLCFYLGLIAVTVNGQVTRVGFYSATCRNAEAIVQATVAKHVRLNPRVAPGLLRLHFHDCFVRGCDGSVLLNGPGTEKTAVQNSGINGYEAIDEAKARLEAVCPGIVSCADILALAARDSVVFTKGFGWRVPTGRRDGKVSISSESSALPGPRETVSSQLEKFRVLGLSPQDLVALVGSHTIGTTSCALFRNRLFNFTTMTANGADPTIDPSFLPTLQAQCPQGGDATRRVFLDNGSGTRFDSSYFNNLRLNRGVLESDQFLWADPTTRPIVERFLLPPRARQALNFNFEFGQSMIRMSNIGVKTGVDDSEIRRVCTSINV